MHKHKHTFAEAQCERELKRITLIKIKKVVDGSFSDSKAKRMRCVCDMSSCDGFSSFFPGSAATRITIIYDILLCDIACGGLAGAGDKAKREEKLLNRLNFLPCISLRLKIPVCSLKTSSFAGEDVKIGARRKAIKEGTTGSMRGEEKCSRGIAFYG